MTRCNRFLIKKSFSCVSGMIIFLSVYFCKLKYKKAKTLSKTHSFLKKTLLKHKHGVDKKHFFCGHEDLISQIFAGLWIFHILQLLYFPGTNSLSISTCLPPSLPPSHTPTAVWFCSQLSVQWDGDVPGLLHMGEVWITFWINLKALFPTLTKMAVTSFALADYVLFALMLVVSAAVGIYYAWVDRSRRNPGNFLTGGRKLTALPVSLSLTASFMSAITVLSFPAEVR